MFLTTIKGEKMKTKNKKQPSQKSIEARKHLIKLSEEAKANIEVLEMTTGETLSVNQMLVKMHTLATNGNTWRTFNDWKKEGFKVKPKETAARIWGKPIKAKKSLDTGTEQQETEEVSKYKLFPMCCIFNENQVEKIGA